mmetsp:Transcript_34264/g.52528  ORF Transcript_34264/g.52528 Transcript_34264/m.52528 type:complete len:90 (+) Transcript_34264:15-284(+)
MFSSLFGANKKPQPQGPVDVTAAKGKLEEQVENISLRMKKVENDINEMKKMAVEKGRKKDKRGAIQALRKSKMMEKELGKLEGQQIMLE